MFPLINKRETGVNMPTIDNLYALSELFQVPIDAIVRGNRAPITSDIIIKRLDSRERRVCKRSRVSISADC